MEINSFIKGSREAMEKRCGCLDEKEYEELGRKMAPYFSGNRKEIYKLFQNTKNFSEITDILNNTFLMNAHFQQNDSLCREGHIRILFLRFIKTTPSYSLRMHYGPLTPCTVWRLGACQHGCISSTGRQPSVHTACRRDTLHIIIS